MALVLEIGIENRENIFEVFRYLLASQYSIKWDSKLDGSTLSCIKSSDQKKVSVSVDTFSDDLKVILPSALLLHIRNGELICIYPPRYCGSRSKLWRVVCERSFLNSENLVDALIKFCGVKYAALSQDETLDLEDFETISEANFPWDHWLLIEAKIA